MQRIAVLGTGGVGGYFGALLAKVGLPVSFIARGEMLAAIRSSGLRIRGTLGDFDIAPADVRAPGEPIADCDLVLVAVKNYDLEEALPALAAIIGCETTVVSLLNGVEAPEQLARCVPPENLIIGQCGVGAWVESPGTIRQEGMRRTMMLAPFRKTRAADERLIVLGSLLSTAGISVTQTDDARAAMWRKLVWVASYGATATLTGLSAGVLRGSPELCASLHEAMTEGLRVARGLGIEAPDSIAEEWLGVLFNLSPTAKPSLLRDRQAGRRMEHDALSGAIVRSGRAVGISTPLHGFLWAALRAIEPAVRRSAASSGRTD